MECIIIIMINIAFTIKLQSEQGDSIRVVGSIPELGTWKPNQGLKLYQNQKQWKSQILQLQKGLKLEFKIIKIKKFGQIIWQGLPNNSNRKYRVIKPAILILQWSKPEGKIHNIAGFNSSIFQNKILSSIDALKFRKETDTCKKQKEFDPFETARDEQSSPQDQSEFVIEHHRFSDNLAINEVDIEQIYFINNLYEVYSSLNKKSRVYVFSNGLQLEEDFHRSILDQLIELSQTFIIKWIYNYSTQAQNKSEIPKDICEKSSIFDIKAEDLIFQSIENIYFLILDIKTINKYYKKFQNRPCCLIINQNKIKDILRILPSEIPIYFDRSNQKNSVLSSSQARFHLENNRNFRESQYRLTDIINKLINKESLTLQNITNEQFACRFSEEKDFLCILDGKLSQRNLNLFNTIVKNVKQNSLLIIVSPLKKDLEQGIVALRERKNIALIYDNFSKLIIQGKQYHPMRKFTQTLGTLRLKLKLYLSIYGGQFLEKQAQFTYILPQHKLQSAKRIQNECKSIIKSYNCFQIDRNDNKLKISWNLLHKARLIRTICQIRHINYGPIGDFYLVSDQNDFFQLEKDIKIISRHKASMFKDPSQIKIICLKAILSQNPQKYPNEVIK